MNKRSPFLDSFFATLALLMVYFIGCAALAVLAGTVAGW